MASVKTKMINKKGIFNTIMLTSIALTLLALSLVVLQSRQDLSESARELALTERINNINSAVSFSLYKLLNSSSDIVVDVQPLFVSFTETLSDKQNKYFAGLVANYEVLLENYTNGTELDTSQFANTLPITIMPHNIVYSHPRGLGDNIIRLTPVDLNFVKYDINVSSINYDIDQTKCVSKFVSGSKQISAKITGPNKESCSYLGSFDPTVANNLTAQTTGKKEIIIRILANTNGTLEVEDVKSVKVDVKTGVTLDELDNGNIDILYTGGVLSIDLGGLGAIKNGSIKLR